MSSTSASDSMSTSTMRPVPRRSSRRQRSDPGRTTSATSCPSTRSRRARFAPTNPAAPVNSVRMMSAEVAVPQSIEVLPGTRAHRRDLVTIQLRGGRPVRLGARRPDGSPRVHLVEGLSVPGGHLQRSGTFDAELLAQRAERAFRVPQHVLEPYDVHSVRVPSLHVQGEVLVQRPTEQVAVEGQRDRPLPATISSYTARRSSSEKSNGLWRNLLTSGVRARTLHSSSMICA